MRKKQTNDHNNNRDDNNTTPTLAMYQNIKNSYRSAYACAKAFFHDIIRSLVLAFVLALQLKPGFSQVEMQLEGIVKMSI